MSLTIPTIYIVAVKIASRIHVVGPKWSENVERTGGPTSKTDPVSDTTLPLHEATMIAKGFGKHVFEGEGNIFLKEKAKKETPAH
jgi:hypothetical protein